MTHPIVGLEGNVRLLRQGIALVECLSDEGYRRGRPGWSPIGAQFRHVLDHYLCFLEGQAQGRIDYDRRRRDASTEQDRGKAVAVAEWIITAIDELGRENPARPLSVHLNSGGDCTEGDWAASTLGRELLFLSSHTVHHYAVIRLLAAGYGVDVGEELGTAPSTLAHARAGS